MVIKSTTIVMFIAFFLFGRTVFADNLEINDSLKQISYQKKVNWSVAKIKSQEDLILYSQNNDSVLDLLSPESKRLFVDSIIFRDNGVAGYRFDILESELTPTQIYQVLSLIGQQHNVHVFKKARIESEEDIILLSKPEMSSAIKEGISNKAGFIENMGGMGNSIDHNGYKCQSKGTCKISSVYICTSNC